MTRTNGPWPHTSDDSYMYQLSLVVAISSIFFGLVRAPDGECAVVAAQFKDGAGARLAGTAVLVFEIPGAVGEAHVI